MSEWIGVAAAVAKLHHLGHAKVRTILIDRAMSGKLPARAGLLRKKIEHDPLGQRLDRYIKLTRDHPNITFPYFSGPNGQNEDVVTDAVVETTFFVPAFAGATSVELGVEVDWHVGDFKRVFMNGDDRVSIEAIAVQFKAAMIEALLAPDHSEPTADRHRRGPKHTYPDDVIVGALVRYASLHDIVDEPGEQAKIIRAICDELSGLGLTPTEETIRKRIRPWLNEVKRQSRVGGHH